MRRRNATATRFTGINVFIFFLVSFVPSDSQDLRDKCVTPNSLMGECIDIRSCPYVLRMLKNRLSMETIETLRRYQCGFQGSQPFVCCPDEVESKTEMMDMSEHPNIRLLPRSVCGHTYTNQLVIAPQTHLYEYPWMALLRYKDGNGLKYRCGGTIISERYILTAAHCITKLPNGLELNKVRVGEHTFNSNMDCEMHVDYKECAPPAEDYGIEETIPHPQFNNKNIQHDIGLIRLDRPINFVRENTQPICLPVKQRPLNDGRRRLEISGWGVTMEGRSSNEMLKASVKTVDTAVCAELYKKYTNVYNGTQLCTEPEYYSGRKCVGDSGGPLIELGRRTVQQGVMSYAMGVCKSDRYPRVFTLVEPYMNWILDSMRDN